VPVAGEGLLEGSVVGLPIADVWALAGRNPDHVSGQMGGTFSITGTARNPIIGASVSIVNAQFNDFNAPQMSGEFRHRDRRVTGDVNLFRRGDPILQVAVDLPYDLGIGRVGQRRISGPLSISARADSVDLSFFDAISPAVRRTEGTFDADLGITGTWERPELTGSMTVDNGAANFPSLGVRYHNINGRVELSADTIYIRALTRESGGGSATVGGFVRLQELSKPILALTIRTADFDAVDIAGFLSLTTAGEVRLDGPVFNATMTGRGTATRGVFYFADLITKEVVNLEDSLFQGLVDTALLQEEGLGAAFENRFLDSLRIDSLGLSIGSEVWLRSGEANIQLTGALVVNKTHREYRLTGELQTPRGSYRLEVLPAVTREFTVTRGTVRYFGTPDLNADLDIDARHIVRTRGREENVDVFINIGGTVYEPRLTLTSDVNPPLSDDEIMAYLLFGGAALDPSETRTAEFAAERVSQVVSGQIENLVISSMDVPLDYFQIRPAARGGLLGGAEIALGKQFTVLGTSAFLTATPRFCPRLQDKPVDIGGSLEFRLSRRWLLQAQAEPRRSCDAFTTESTGTFEYQFGLDLIWELSY
jgi:autotransporter translocation and assembly factor TamB